MQQSGRRANLYGLWVLGALVVIDYIMMTQAFNRPWDYIDAGTFRLRFTWVLFWVAWWFGKRKQYKMQAVMLISSLYLSYLVMPLLEPSGLTHPAEHYFVLLFITLALSVVPYLLFDLQKDRGIILFWQITLPITFFAAFMVNLQRFAFYPQEAYYVQLTRDQYMAFCGYAGVYIFLMAITLQYKRSQYRYQKQMVDTNAQLQQSLALVRRQNYDLGQLHQQLREKQVQQSKNNERLEQEVQERTAEVAHQNQQLLEYNFMHGHVLKAPLARIQGLLHLDRLIQQEEERQQIRHMAEDAFWELDQAVESIARIIEEQDQELIHQIQEQTKQLYSEGNSPT
ncbi:MAG TPA: hypothetical protein DCR93_15595 [Cytophagales bacterium]|nr:hypothetical protein [Cytophagales bacterium]